MAFKDLTRKALNVISGGISNLSGGAVQVSEDTFWKFCNDLWQNAKSKKKEVLRAYRYWDGELTTPILGTNIFPDQTHSNDNIVQEITETKISNLLDAQFEIAVVPAMGAFYDISALKDAQAVADILNEEIQNIDKANSAELVDELVCRDGELCGLGGSQVEWSTKDRVDGEVKINHIPTQDLRWIDNTLFAFEKEYSVTECKELFAKDKDGNFIEDICKEIDEIATVKIGDKSRRQTGSVINYVNEQNQTAGQVFALDGGIGGVQAGKIVKLIVMYLLDDSCYAPEEQDDTEEAEMKQTFKRAYPNGRKIVFHADSDKKMIFADEPLDETFKNLGNIDTYNPIIHKGIDGKSPVEVVFPIQDRIDGLYKKYRVKVQCDIDTVIIDEDFGIEDGAFVTSPLTRVKDYNKLAKNVSEPMSNDAIAKSMQILEAVDKLKSSAYQKVGLNPTMMSGYRQTGTSSAEQVEALQESPMVKIRRQQRNFKNYRINRAEKCMLFIMRKYSDQRLIQLSTGIEGADIAQIRTNPNTNKREIALLKDVEGVIKEIRSIAFNDKWQFKVECSAGTEIPRSRKELADLTDKISISPVMQSGDLELIEMYLTANDYPKRRALMTLLRQKQTTAQIPVNKTAAMQDSLKNPQAAAAFADTMKALVGFSAAQQAYLRGYGFIGQTDTIVDAPIQSITAKSSVKDIAAIAPAQISRKPEQAIFGNKAADDIENKKAENKLQPAGVQI